MTKLDPETLRRLALTEPSPDAVVAALTATREGAVAAYERERARCDGLAQDYEQLAQRVEAAVSFLRYMQDEFDKARRDAEQKGGQHAQNFSPYARMPPSARGKLERDLSELRALLDPDCQR